MVPSIFGENLFDEFWNDPFDMDRMLPRGRDPLYGKHSKNLMKTDVRETEGSYELDVDLPGFKKEEVNVELNNGYLTIEAAKTLKKEYIYQAALMDPHMQSELSIDDIVALCDDMIEAHKGWLPEYH